jgi:Zn-dependent membrane protease YugP
MNHLAFIIGYNSAWFLMIVVAVVSFFVQWRFKTKFNQYAEISLLSGLTGKEVAEKMLADNQISDVQSVKVRLSR